MDAQRVEYEGKTYVFDLEDMDDVQARAMENFGVPNLKALAEGIVCGDLAALTVAYWLMKRQDGAKLRLEDVSFKPLKFLRALDEATAVENSDPKDGPAKD